MSKTPQPKENKYYTGTALTLLFGGIVFLILLAIAIVISGMMIILDQTGALAELRDNVFNSPTLLTIFLAVVSLLVGAGLTLAFSRIVMTPMRRIIVAMNRVASGNYHTRLRFPGIIANHPTFALLVMSFNKMTEELENTEILRGDFINNFSHEFKTPIVSIAGFAKLLKRDNLSEAQRSEYIDIIEEESMRLSTMATNVLNLSRIESQAILTDVTEFNLSEQVRSCVLLLEKKWTQKNIEWDLEFDEFMIHANEDMLKQVWINLLENAIKFCHPGGTVSVSVRRQADRLSVSIADTGEEIPPDQLTRIFQKFYQGDTSHAQEGNGVGLAVVQGIVSLHGGSVTAASGSGVTTFTVTLPA